jgi:hypothetical protein
MGNGQQSQKSKEAIETGRDSGEDILNAGLCLTVRTVSSSEC